MKTLLNKKKKCIKALSISVLYVVGDIMRKDEK